MLVFYSTKNKMSGPPYFGGEHLPMPRRYGSSVPYQTPVYNTAPSTAMIPHVHVGASTGEVRPYRPQIQMRDNKTQNDIFSFEKLGVTTNQLALLAHNLARATANKFNVATRDIKWGNRFSKSRNKMLLCALNIQDGPHPFCADISHEGCRLPSTTNIPLAVQYISEFLNDHNADK